MIDFVKLASKWRSTREPLSFDSEGIFRVKKTKQNTVQRLTVNISI